ncbi:hypothetical protein AC1031_013149 [Aphanomyces cochlioides]|nr:hypothetical protein AC1031_013149 [Aphanomyces cochlioides]
MKRHEIKPKKGQVQERKAHSSWRPTEKLHGNKTFHEARTYEEKKRQLKPTKSPTQTSYQVMAQIEQKRRVALEKLQKNQKVNCVPQQPLHQVVPNRDVLIQQELDACEDFFDEIPEDISVMTHEMTFPNFQLLKAQTESAVVPNDKINYIPPYKAANKHSVKNNQNYTWQQQQHVKLMATSTTHTSSQTVIYTSSCNFTANARSPRVDQSIAQVGNHQNPWQSLHYRLLIMWCTQSNGALHRRGLYEACQRRLTPPWRQLNVTMSHRLLPSQL